MEIRHINFNGDINEANTNGLILELQKALQDNVEKVHINMSSIGGHFVAAFKMYDYLIQYPLPISIMNVKEVSSSAVVIFLAIKKRDAVADATFSIHPPVWQFEPNAAKNIKQLESIISELKHDEQRYAEILDKCTSDVDGIKLSNYLSGESITISRDMAYRIGLCTSDSK